MIQRYTLVIGDNRSYQTGMEKHRNGEYVKYADIRKALEDAYQNGVKDGIQQEKDAAEYWSKH